MEIMTKHFGTVNVESSKIVAFNEGIFGFKEEKEFVLLYDQGEDGSPLVWLQAIHNPEVCLPLIHPMMWFQDYAPDVDDEMIESIGELNPEELEVFTVVVIPDTIEEMTTNLKAPILVNRETKKGCQVIANDDIYEVRHNLYQQMKLMSEGGDSSC